MTQPYRLEPDLDFVRDVISCGGDTLKKCFQCATCSVVCPLSPDDSPFPRKEMIQAQWGMKDKLVRDPDIWLCHNCKDCSTHCPRGAKPGDVLNVLRQKAIEHYSFPEAVASKVRDKRFLPLLLAIPTIIFALVIFFTNSFGEATIVLHGETIADFGERIISWKMIPMLAVDIIFMATALFAVLVFANGAVRLWKDLDAQRARQQGFIGAAIEVIKDIITHENFKECGTEQERYLGHMGVFYGFVALFITTTCIFLGIYFLNLVVHIAPTPWSLLNPVKWLANAGALALLIGCFLLIRQRLQSDEEETKSSYYDWFLIVLVTAVGASGFLAEIIRLLGFGFLFYVVYFIHLVCVWSLFAYAPYSKLAHLVYRTVALIHAKACGRYLMEKGPVVAVAETVAAAPEAPAE